jgi:hypothetical protein
VGFNLRGLSLSALLFFACIAASLLLIANYWLGMSVFRLLTLLGGAAVGTVVFGHRALRSMAAARVKSE